MVPCEADDVVRGDFEFKTIVSRIIDVAIRGEKSEGCRAGKRFSNAKNLNRGQSRATCMTQTCNTRDKQCSGSYKNVLETQ